MVIITDIITIIIIVTTGIPTAEIVIIIMDQEAALPVATEHWERLVKGYHLEELLL